jgi:GT2 family glycosyltransferase
LYRNEENLGFVKTVNRGFKIAENHVALLNTDIELPEQWLERLMSPILSDSTIASTTPFSNAATIFSFPIICEDNKMIEGLSVNDVDSAFSRLSPSYYEAPTAVGFCMGINSVALNEVGLLDEDTFEKGYGEENDWCQRAILAGYRNVQVEDMFVYHKHGGSFNSEEKENLINSHLQYLNRMYPNYAIDVEAFIQDDPAYLYRECAKLLLIQKRTKGTNLYFNHSQGGGADMYLQERLKQEIEDGKSVAVITYDETNSYFICEFKDYDLSCTFRIVYFYEIAKLIEKIDNIIINELVGYTDLASVLSDFVDIAEYYSAPIEYLLHDYYSVCPTVKLVDCEDKYCDLPSEEICDTCLNCNEHVLYETKSIERWRASWNTFFNQCEKIIVFSDAAQSIFSNIYNEQKNIDVVPHKAQQFLPVNLKSKSPEDPITIATLGSISQEKGRDIIIAMSEIAKKSEDKIKIVLIGILDVPIENKNVTITGPYDRDDIPRLVEKYEADIIFIPSIWPETFSYTTKEAISLDIPVASFDIGAQAGHLKKYGKGLVIDELTAIAAYSSIKEFVKENRMR